MATTKNIIMKQKNSSDYDTIYPIIEETYGGDKVKCIECPHCGRPEQLSFLTRFKKEGFEIPDEIID